METILWLQGFSQPLLDRFFLTVTGLGSEEFYMVLIPVLYWCFNRVAGIRLGLLFLISTYINFTVKDALQMPRPQGPGLRVLAEVPGYGFPSNHAQSNAVVWGYLSLVFRRRWLLLLSAAIVILVSLSRVYLGLHYPADVIAGAAAGLILAALFHGLVRRFQGMGVPLGAQLLGAVLVPLASLIPYHGEDAFRLAGTFFGLGVGHIIQERYVGFSEKAGPIRQLFKIVLGVGGLFLVRTYLRPFLPDGAALFGRYAMMGLWVTLLAPLLFRLLRLAPAGGDTMHRRLRPGRTAVLALLAAVFATSAGLGLGLLVQPLPASAPVQPDAVPAPGPDSPTGGGAGRIQLVAVQMRWDAQDYITTERFAARVDGLMQQVAARLDPNLPALVVFPEDVGILTVFNGSGQALEGAGNLAGAVENMVQAHLPEVMWQRARYRVSWPRAIFLARHEVMAGTYLKVFSEAARRYGVYLVAGSAPLADNNLPADGSLPASYRPASGDVYNVSYFFGPDGRIIGRQKKVHLIDIEGPQGLDLVAGRASEIEVFSTPLGRIGIAICLDAFRDDVLAQLERQGAQILVQPSANPKPWTAEQEADWRNGSWKVVVENKRFAYAVNPMMVGTVFDLGFFGQSSLIGADGFLAEGAWDDGEEVLVVTVPHPATLQK